MTDKQVTDSCCSGSLSGRGHPLGSFPQLSEGPDQQLQRSLPFKNGPQDVREHHAEDILGLDAREGVGMPRECKHPVY